MGLVFKGGAAMKNHKQLLADFYLALLSYPPFHKMRGHQSLYAEVRAALASELGESEFTIQLIFERMADEDAKI